MNLQSGPLKEEYSLNQRKLSREDLLLMPTKRREEKPLNYQNMRVEVLRALIFVAQEETEALSEQDSADESGEFSLAEIVRRIEAGLIRAALIRTGGRQRRAARLLGVKVPTLIAKIKRYNINLVEIINSHQKKGNNIVL